VWGLAVQHGQLMTEHQDLQVLGGITAGEPREQLDGATRAATHDTTAERAEYGDDGMMGLLPFA
jgi:hypothetical protein